MSVQKVLKTGLKPLEIWILKLQWNSLKECTVLKIRWKKFLIIKMPLRLFKRQLNFATNFNIAPGEGYVGYVKGMNMENMQKMAGSLVPEGFIESLNAQLIKIKK